MSYRDDTLYEDDYVRLVNTADDTYLVQGDMDEEVYMVRNWTDLLECERDAVQRMVWQQELERDEGGSE